MTGGCLSHCVLFHICHIILSTLLWLKTIITFVCGTLVVSAVVVVVAADDNVAKKFIYSSHYEFTSYTLVIF